MSANATDLAAHVTIHNAPDEGHASSVIHTVADEKSRLRRGSCRSYKAINLFREMLAVRIEKDRPSDFSSGPMSESCLNRFAFTAVLIVNKDFSAGFARAVCGLIARAVINHQDVIESFTGSANNVPDMFFVLICRNDCGGLRSYIRFCHVEQSRDISVLDPEIPRLRFASLGMTMIASARTVPRIYFLIGA